MKLRSRLTIALIGVATAGLIAFGVATSSLYRGSLLDQLDAQLSTAGHFQGDQLRRMVAAGVASSSCSTDSSVATLGPGVPPTGGGPGAPALDTESRLFLDGAQVACVSGPTNEHGPEISRELATTDRPIHRTVDASTGGGRWRVAAAPVGPIDPRSSNAVDAVVVVAQPTTALDESMSRLIRIELATGAGLLLLLGIGSWLVLRRGMRPLEDMAASTTAITVGDLSHRFAPADPSTEVGRLGIALNTMMEGIEEAFAQRAETERRLRQFLADAAHELRTPITSIQGFAELFRLGDTPDLPVIMSRIGSESARMHRLIEDLLLLARLDRTRPVGSDPVDLTVLAADACTDAAAVQPERPITLHAPDPVIVNGDTDHLRQAITNLITNALHHTPEYAAIEVAVSVMQGQANVLVRDHGPGLDVDGLTHAFDRFWQADAARVGSGVGLGLSIVAGIAAEHDGRVMVENAPGGGAVFTLSIPLQRNRSPI